MDFFGKILDLPVIVQGALGSFLFWLAYEISKRFFDLVLEFGTRVNHDWRMEYLLSQQSHILQELCFGDGYEITNIGIKLVSVQLAVNRAMHGVIYIVLGLVSQPFLGDFSIIAYLVSLAYFYRALKASHIDIESRHNEEWYRAKLESLGAEIQRLKDRRNAKEAGVPNKRFK